MNEHSFWKIIDESKRASKNDINVQEEFLVQELEKLIPEDVIQFEIILRKMIMKANDYKVVAFAKIIDGYVSDDSFLYFRCWIIAQGLSFYNLTLENPDLTADLIYSETEYDFESLLYVADQAYQNLRKDSDEDELPREVARLQGFDYDDLSQEITGEDWIEDDLPKLYPKLWTKFGAEKIG